MSLGKRLKNSRKKANYRQTDVAKILGIDNTTISKWESDTYEPNAVQLKRLAELYEVTTDYLLDHSQSDDEPNLAFIDGGENLSDDEVEYLRESLEVYRKRKERFLREREKDNQS